MSCVEYCLPAQITISRSLCVQADIASTWTPENTGLVRASNIVPALARAYQLIQQSRTPAGSDHLLYRLGVDTRTILAELHATLHNLRRSRSIAKEPPLTIPAGPQHKVTAYLQGQNSSTFIRQLHCARLDLELIRKLCIIASLTHCMLKT